MKRDGSIIGMESYEPGTPNMDDPGFRADGSHIIKKGTPVTYGAQMGHIFNKLPPGMDITNQDVTDQRPMELKKVTMISFPGDGGFKVKDVPE
jgi:hypothetical protein